jgi:phosphatidylinositol kinase/protein kinase (PI-3  family)
MLHANIPDIVGDGKVDPKMSIMKVQEKFMLNLKDTEAIQYMQNVITDSVGSFSGRLLDWAHEVELLIT